MRYVILKRNINDGNRAKVHSSGYESEDAAKAALTALADELGIRDYDRGDDHFDQIFRGDYHVRYWVQMEGYRVAPAKCSTCIFSADSPLTPEGFEKQRAAWEAEGVVQQCHHATLSGNDTGCYGHYQAALNGGLKNHPVIEIARNQGLPVDQMDTRQIFSLYENMGLIQFEDVPDLDFKAVKNRVKPE